MKCRDQMLEQPQRCLLKVKYTFLCYSKTWIRVQELPYMEAVQEASAHIAHCREEQVISYPREEKYMSAPELFL